MHTTKIQAVEVSYPDEINTRTLKVGTEMYSAALGRRAKIHRIDITNDDTFVSISLQDLHPDEGTPEAIVFGHSIDIPMARVVQIENIAKYFHQK